MKISLKSIWYLAAILLTFISAVQSAQIEWQSKLSVDQVAFYRSLVDQKNSYDRELSEYHKYSTSFEPESADYYSSILTFGSAFYALSAFTFIIILTILFLKVFCGHFKGKKEEKITQKYKMYVWALFTTASVIYLSISISILIKNADIHEQIQQSLELVKSVNEGKLGQKITSLLDKEKELNLNYKNKTKLDEKLQTGFKQYAELADRNTDGVESWESANFTMNIAFFSLYSFGILLTFVAFKVRKPYMITFILILMLFFLPLIIASNGNYSVMYFVTADLCENVFNAMYEDLFPVYGKGIGYVVNAMDAVSS